MVGFPYYFHVNAGHPVLQHPLYLKYNVLSIAAIAQLDSGSGIKNLMNAMSLIMQTNDNMAILWYLRNLLKTATELGF
jgi:hypothetical protein